jgi:ABC-type sulfate transport system substrate-binding protein
MWNENPYYILDVPWSSEAQRSAARAFLQFLMSEESQAKALAYGFRPGNPKVGVNFPESPFLQNERYGIRIDIPRIAEPPKAEVVDTLISSFRRAN